MEIFYAIVIAVLIVVFALTLYYGIPQAREFQDRTGDRSWLLALTAFRRLP